MSLDQPDDVLDTACRMLLATDEPVPVDGLAAALHTDLDTVATAVAEHERNGRMGLDADGRIVASAGLSIVPSAYRMRVGDRVLWAWCAKTALGVLGALHIGGEITSRSPYSGAELRTLFVGPDAADTGAAVFWPSDDYRDSCGSAAGEYCTAFGLFEDPAAARAWAADNHMPGEVMTVPAATARAVRRWRHSLDVAGAGRDLPAALAASGPAG